VKNLNNKNIAGILIIIASIVGGWGITQENPIIPFIIAIILIAVGVYLLLKNK